MSESGHGNAAEPPGWDPMADGVCVPCATDRTGTYHVPIQSVPVFLCCGLVEEAWAQGEG